MQTRKNTTIRSVATATKGPFAGPWLQSIYTQSLLEWHYPRAQPKPLQQQKGPLQVTDFKGYTLKAFWTNIVQEHNQDLYNNKRALCKSLTSKFTWGPLDAKFSQDTHRRSTAGKTHARTNCSKHGAKGHQASSAKSLLQGLRLAFGIVTKELSHGSHSWKW